MKLDLDLDALVAELCGRPEFFGHDVSVLTGSHDVVQRGVARQQAIPSEGNDIHIGKDCWIASKATILGPCIIEDNVIVAAGSVVAGGGGSAGDRLDLRRRAGAQDQENTY